jgi:hypothetical protein
LVRQLLSQSPEVRTVSVATPDYLVQQDAALTSPERSACIGGHGTEP